LEIVTKSEFINSYFEFHFFLYICDLKQISFMKLINWNAEKNELLKKERNISFEEIATAINENKVFYACKHPNKDKYPNQFIYYMYINEYVYLVPFVENEKEIFLKTIIPSSKETKKYKSE